jgi:hypothetical protein
VKALRTLRFVLMWLPALVVIVPPSSAAIGEESPAGIAAAFRYQMRSRRLESRLEAVNKLAELPPADAAALLFAYALGDSAPEVRRAATEVLLRYDDRPAVGRALLAQLEEATRTRRMDDRFGLALPLLAACEEKDVQLATVRYLDGLLGTPKADLSLVIGLIDEQGQLGDYASAVRTLDLLSQAEYFTSHFGYRRSVVLAAGQITEPPGIELMIRLLPRTDGLARHDLVVALTSTTGQKLGYDDRLWRKWWNEQAGTFRVPEPAPSQSQHVVDDGAPQYYGIPIHARRIVFVLDTSGSMAGGQIEAAKRELIRAVESLPATSEFNVVIYNSRVRRWEPKLVRADEETKRVLTKSIESETASGQTSSYKALQEAFELTPEAIYFLSDGEPTDATPAKILAEITRLNRERRISLHTIGIGTGFGAPIFGEFLRALADGNLGEFRAVNR